MTTYILIGLVMFGVGVVAGWNLAIYVITESAKDDPALMAGLRDGGLHPAPQAHAQEIPADWWRRFKMYQRRYLRHAPKGR